MIYFDNAATTQMSEVALDALSYVSKECFGNPSSIYSYGRHARELLEEARQDIATCIGADNSEIYFTSCGTESDNWAVLQAATQNCKKIITTRIEHHAILFPIDALNESDIAIERLPVDYRGIVDEELLKKALDGNKTFVSVMFQNNETGIIQPIKKMAKSVHNINQKSLFHTDAIQAIGHVKIDVKDLGVDMLSASAHKFNGPKGTGFLYIKEGCMVSPFIYGGGQEKSMRSGTENVAGVYAMAKALKENVENLEKHRKNIFALEEKLLKGLRENGVIYKINGDNSSRAVGVINISIKDIDAEGLLHVLDMHDICVSIGSACNSKNKKPSHVLTEMGLDSERIDASIRISIGRYNSEADVDALIREITKYYNVTG